MCAFFSSAIIHLLIIQVQVEANKKSKTWSISRQQNRYSNGEHAHAFAKRQH